jgi:HSP20 family protein
MSWDDNRDFDDDDDEAKRRIRRWFGDFIPEDVLRQIEEMMERMMSEMNQGAFLDPEKFEEMIRNQQGTNPFLFGFSMNLGPDGKPVIKRFGNVPGEQGEVPILEPLVDVVEEDGEIVVVAEVPGVDRNEIKVRIKGTELTIHADNPERPYHKVIQLPAKVMKDEAKSSIRNGVLEVRLKKA